MACKDTKCVVWWDHQHADWVVYSDCSSPCRCLLDGLTPPGPREPEFAIIRACVAPTSSDGDQVVGNSQASLMSTVTFADSWVMQRRCDAFCDIGCEWSLGDGKVYRTGFKSTGTPQPRYQVLEGNKAELVIFGGMSNGMPNIENGLPDPWIIGYADFGQAMNSGSRRMNIAGFTSFKIEDNA